jgi:hypothetical protein
MAVFDESGARQVQAGVRSAERRQRAGNRQRTVLSQPVSGLERCPRPPDGEDRRRSHDQLPRREAGGNHDGADDPERAVPAPLARLARQVDRPPPGHPIQHVDRQRRDQRRRDQQCWHRREHPGEQQGQPGDQPAGHDDRGQCREAGESAAGFPASTWRLLLDLHKPYRQRRARQPNFRHPDCQRPGWLRRRRRWPWHTGGRLGRILRSAGRFRGGIGRARRRIRGSHGNHCKGRHVVRSMTSPQPPECRLKGETAASGATWPAPTWGLTGYFHPATAYHGARRRQAAAATAADATARRSLDDALRHAPRS